MELHRTARFSFTKYMVVETDYEVREEEVEKTPTKLAELLEAV